VASQLLDTIGDNPERLATEAQFAALTGTVPIPASSGKTTRHPLSRCGDRAANAAIHRIVPARMATDQRTQEYVVKRTAEGKSKMEIMRCLSGCKLPAVQQLYETRSPKKSGRQSSKARLE
jgi:transposase